MRRMICFFVAYFILGLYNASGQQIGKYVPIVAGSDADHAIAEMNAATDPAQKLAILDKFAAGPGSEGDLAILADSLYVEYYLAQKSYDKAFEYGDKLFKLDPDNFPNAMNMVRVAAEKGDVDHLISYSEKAQDILQRFSNTPAPTGIEAQEWEKKKALALESNKDGIAYVQQLAVSGGYQVKDPGRRAALLVKFAQMLPDSPLAAQALGVAATSYQQAQNTPKMLEVANGLLAKDTNNLGMLLLLSDYYSETGEQLDKADGYVKKAVALLDTLQKPEGVAEAQWAQQKTLQKGLALSSLGQINMQKKQNELAIVSLKAAAPLLKANDVSYARNQYRLGFALLNLKRDTEAKDAFTQAASVNTPYRALAQDKLNQLARSARRKAS